MHTEVEIGGYTDTHLACPHTCANVESWACSTQTRAQRCTLGTQANGPTVRQGHSGSAEGTRQSLVGEGSRAQGVLLLEEHDVWGHLPAPSAPGPQVQQSEGSDRGSTVTQAPRSGPWPGACTAPHGILRALPKVPPPLGPLLTSGMSFRMFPLGFSLELSFCTYPQLGDQGL